jgi:hypothetical protein
MAVSFIPDQIIEFTFDFLPALPGPGVYSVSTKMSTRDFPGGKGQLVHKADNLTATCPENMEAKMSHNPMSLHGLIRG